MISFCFYISDFTVSTILELGLQNGRGKENIRERNKHIPVQWIQKFKRGRKRIKNKGRTEKGRSLSALLDLLRGNIRPETPDWLPVDTHTCTHTHVHARTHTLADTFVLSGPMGAKLLLARLLNIGVSKISNCINIKVEVVCVLKLRFSIGELNNRCKWQHVINVCMDRCLPCRPSL